LTKYFLVGEGNYGAKFNSMFQPPQTGDKHLYVDKLNSSDRQTSLMPFKDEKDYW